MADTYGAAVYTANGLVREVVFSPFVVDQVWEMTLPAGVWYQQSPMPVPKTLAQPHAYSLGSNGSFCQMGIIESKGVWFVSRFAEEAIDTETFRLVWLYV